MRKACKDTCCHLGHEFDQLLIFSLRHYEAQRHWMEVTTALPLLQWYEPGPDNDLEYWGLDYPPLTAFHSWLLGMLDLQVDPSCFALHASRGHETLKCKALEAASAFMRSSVIASDLLIYLPGQFLGQSQRHSVDIFLPLPYERIKSSLTMDISNTTVFVWASHWQLLAALPRSGLCQPAPGVLFTLALLYKQISLYYAFGLMSLHWDLVFEAPAFFFGILSQCMRPFALDRAALGVSSAGVAVIFTSLLLFGPWLLAQSPMPNSLTPSEPEALLQVLHRMFPFARGLYEDKVANFWCSISVVLKVQRLVPPGRLPFLCALTTLIALLPSALCITFHIFNVLLSLCFSGVLERVHEKGVLFPSLAVCLLPDAVSEEWKSLAWILALHFQLVSLFSMSLGIVSWTEHSIEN
eukprot:Skav210156  [mRNA]  locus=scaffold1811:19851:26076:+ [translate_table: standard]